MRFMMVVSPAAATGRACSGAPCLITYQSGPIRMEARLREIERERKGEAEVDAQQNCFTSAHTSESIPRGAWPLTAPGSAPPRASRTSAPRLAGAPEYPSPACSFGGRSWFYVHRL